MIPRNVPENISTSDYLFNGEKFDLKQINGNSHRCIDSLVKNSKKQTNNFILDISNTDLSIQNILEQINKLYHSPQRNWINTIILIKDNTLISAFTRI